MASIVQSVNPCTLVTTTGCDRENSFHIEPLNITQVVRLLETTKESFAASHDGIPGHLIKSLAMDLALNYDL